jgi:phosphatidylserine/phosphatidylglycerophosphate/cardiolipin synthase-like enzyme
VSLRIATGALRERAAAGVRIRICYDGDKPIVPDMAGGQDPAPPGTGAFVQALGFPWRRIGGMKLMHDKFIVRDGAAIWSGSLNLTDDAFTLMENNVITLDSRALAAFYEEDFEQIWQKENFENTGHMPRRSSSGQPATVRVMFSPKLIRDSGECGAQRRVRICSLLINAL